MVETLPKADEEPIERAHSNIDPEDYKILFDLNRSKPWLEKLTTPLVELWNMCGAKGERELVVKLINNFEVLGLDRLGEFGEQIADQVTQKWGCVPENTRIIAISDDFEADGSQMLLQILKNKFTDYGHWSERNFINNYSSGLANMQDGFTAILLDDFIGTGTTIIRKYERFALELKKRGINVASIKLLAVSGMEFSKSTIDSLNVDYYVPLWLKKGIQDNFTENELPQAVKQMEALENKLGRKWRKLRLTTFEFGFSRSESLFSIELCNVPNNVFPIFWWPLGIDKKRRNTMFKRLR